MEKKGEEGGLSDRNVAKGGRREGIINGTSKKCNNGLKEKVDGCVCVVCYCYFFNISGHPHTLTGSHSTHRKEESS